MGVSQAHLAKKINVTNTTYSRIERGESKLDVERLKIISIALGLDVKVFFDSELTKSVILKLENSNYHQKQLA